MSDEAATVEVSAEIKGLGDQLVELTLKQAKELSDYLKDCLLYTSPSPRDS